MNPNEGSARIVRSPDPLAQRALVYLRGRGEGAWASHHAPECRLRATPAGLELTLRDAWQECARQGRRGLLLLGADSGEAERAARAMEQACASDAPELAGLERARVPVRLTAADRAADDDSLASWISKAAPGVAQDSELLLIVDGAQLPPTAAAQFAREAAELERALLLVSGSFELDALALTLSGLLLELQLAPAPLERARVGGSAAAAGPELAMIPAGHFLMGSPDEAPGRWGDEGPQHEVALPAFRMGRHAVSNAEFQRFLDACPEEPLPACWADARFNADLQPVVGVGFDQAERFARWSGLRLPSEAEWEYACRAGSTAERYGELDEVAWHMGNSADRLREVGGRAPNAFGLHDLLGNAWEWVADERHDDYVGAPSDGSAWVDGARQPIQRLLRGGSWADSPRTVRATTRLTDHPGPRVGNVGLRLAADA